MRLPVIRLALPLAAATLLAAPLHAQQATTPDSATIARGKALFQGRGTCFSCHGMQGEGMLGPTTVLNGNKPKWLHHDGSIAGIIKVITGGIDAEHSTSGQEMPPKGGSKLTDAQVAQVAAYVWSLHRTKPAP